MRLRPVEIHDIDYIRDLARNPENDEFFRRQPPENMWPTDGQVMQWYLSSFVVEVEDELKGLVTVVNHDQACRSVEVGIVIEKGPERRETMLEAMHTIATHLYDTLNMEKMWVRVLPSRTSLAEYMKSFGFVKEGTSRRSLYWKGQWHDEVTYSLLKEEWNSLKHPVLKAQGG